MLASLKRLYYDFSTTITLPTKTGMRRSILPTQSSLRTIVKPVYNRIREYTPRKFAVFNGVPSRSVRMLDMTDVYPDYKEGFINAIYDVVDYGDRVVLIAGGRGVTSVHAAKAGGRVVAYEAASEMLAVLEETIAVNDVDSRVETRHALVGEAIDVFGDYGDAAIVSPASLDTGDVLLLDCEGAERSILDGLTNLPPTVIVETHPRHGVPTEGIHGLLTERGYEVEAREYEPDHSGGKRVIVGRRS